MIAHDRRLRDLRLVLLAGVLRQPLPWLPADLHQTIRAGCWLAEVGPIFISS